MPATIRRSKRRAAHHGAKITQDHHEIRNWVEAHDGQPALTKDGTNVLRLRFANSDEAKPISWSHFFRRFDDEKLAMVYQEMGDGGEMRYFCRLLPQK